MCTFTGEDLCWGFIGTNGAQVIDFGKGKIHNADRFATQAEETTALGILLCAGSCPCAGWDRSPLLCSLCMPTWTRSCAASSVCADPRACGPPLGITGVVWAGKNTLVSKPYTHARLLTAVCLFLGRIPRSAVVLLLLDGADFTSVCMSILKIYKTIVVFSNPVSR